MTLVDTCVVIDILRGNERALAWVDAQSRRPCISVVSIAELEAGLFPRERDLYDKVLRGLTSIVADETICVGAGRFLNQYKKSHGLDPLDAIIAATALDAELELVTLNLKHFPMFDGLMRPY